MSHYAKGARFEHKVIAALEKAGFTCIRSAGSKGDSKIDVIAIRPGALLFVQCKTDGTLRKSEWDRILEVSRWVGATAALASNGVNGRGIVLSELTGEKVAYARVQPMVPLFLDTLS